MLIFGKTVLASWTAANHRQTKVKKTVKYMSLTTVKQTYKKTYWGESADVVHRYIYINI